MLLIFDLFGGLTDMLRDLVSIYNFCLKYKYNFTIRNASSRSAEKPDTGYTSYSIDNLINVQSFTTNEYYIEYSTIIGNVNDSNTYDFFKDKVEGRLWKNRHFLSEDDVICSIKNTNKEYVIIGGSFWYYTNLHDMYQLARIFKTLIPSHKIIEELNANIITDNYNCIHYRYENDWIPNLRNWGIPYIVPPLDVLINNLPFKNKHLIYICTNNIENLYAQNLLHRQLETYDNIIYKKKNNLNYDENGFLDLLITQKCDEFYGNSVSGFTQLAAVLKNSFNFYNKMECLNKYNIITD